MICNVPGARALERAKAANVPAILLPHGAHPLREEYDARLVEELRRHDVNLVCLAGFMRIVTPVLLRAFPERVLNIHPSLLPAFPGMHAVRQALAAGVRISGCTVHLVDEGTDSGPIVVQAAVPVLDGDSEKSHLELGRDVESAIIVANRFRAPARIKNDSKGDVQIGLNTGGVAR